MANSRIFIGTKPFIALEDGIRQTNAEFALLNQLGNMQPAYNAWRLVTKIVARFRTLGSQSQSIAIDPAYNLIYLTTGVLYHHISKALSVVPAHVEPFATVEPLEKLLSDCAWKHCGDCVKTIAILESLIDALQNNLAELGE